jgi:hypothetical protein
MRLLALSCAAILAFSGCSASSVAKKLAPQDVQDASERVIADLRARRFGAVKEQLTDELRGRNLAGVFERMAGTFPDGRPTSVAIIGYDAIASTSGSRLDITYEYQFPDSWVVAQLAWTRDGSQLRLLNFQVTPRRQSVEEENALTFRGKGALHYLVVLTGACAFALSLFALVRCARTKGLGRKWLWEIFIILGFGTFSLNWTTGEWHVSLLSCQVFSFSAAEFTGPWMVSVSVPVGAVLFLDRMRRQGLARRASSMDGFRR